MVLLLFTGSTWLLAVLKARPGPKTGNRYLRLVTQLFTRTCPAPGEALSCDGGRVPKGEVPIHRQMPGIRHYMGREMPSFFIFDCRVVRFIARRAAAPFGPLSTQPVSRRT